ncbi:MAG: hypothetical protein R3D00_13390 [Bacteroidia bacterium]
MKLLKYFFPLILVFLTGCSQKEEVPPISDNEVSIRFEQKISLPSKGLAIQFASVETDSRCPTGVECIWEGEVLVKLSVSLTDQEPVGITLGLSSRPEVQKMVTIGDHTIELIAVNPYPVYGKKVPYKDYEIVVKVI